MFSQTEYIIWTVIAVLWIIQILFLFLLYNTVNREAKRRRPATYATYQSPIIQADVTKEAESTSRNEEPAEEKDKKPKHKGIKIKKPADKQEDTPIIQGITPLTVAATQSAHTEASAPYISDEPSSQIHEQAVPLKTVEDKSVSNEERISIPANQPLQDQEPVTEVDEKPAAVVDDEPAVVMDDETAVVMNDETAVVMNEKPTKDKESTDSLKSVESYQATDLIPNNEVLKASTDINDQPASPAEQQAISEEEPIAPEEQPIVEPVEEQPVSEDEARPSSEGELFSSNDDEDSASDATPQPPVNNDGFFGDLFGEAFYTPQPPKKKTSKSRTMAESARPASADELIISEQEIQKTLGTSTLLPTISIIMATNNQDMLLRKNLPAILQQDYPSYEVIIVNDNSTDDTADILRDLQAQYPHLRTTFTPGSSRRISHKKLALTLGIKAAKNDWLLFTEPGCHPVDNHWLQCMARQLPMVKDPFYSDVDAVIGYTGYEPQDGLGSYLRCYDRMHDSLRLLGLGLHHMAHMGYGTNLIYRREIFFKHKGYSAHLHLERGEDDIFVNRNIQPSRIRAEVSSDAIVRSSENTSRHWLLEKLGRIATRRHLHGFMPLLLGIDTVTRALYALATLAAIVVAIIMKWWITLGIVIFLWALRYAGQWFVFTRASRHFGESNYGPAMPLLDLCQPAWELGILIRYLLSSKSAYRRKQI